MKQLLNIFLLIGVCAVLYAVHAFTDTYLLDLGVVIMSIAFMLILTVRVADTLKKWLREETSKKRDIVGLTLVIMAMPLTFMPMVHLYLAPNMLTQAYLGMLLAIFLGLSLYVYINWARSEEVLDIF